MAPSTTRPLQGRRRELGVLAELVGLTGRPPGAVLLAGDAGVGKTRLLAELVDRAADAGVRALVGHCLDFGDSALPYLPFTELFGRLATESPDLVEDLTAAHPALAHLQPGRRLMSGSGPAVDDLDRSDLFETVHGVLEDLAAPGPLLVVVEDVHWADRSTRDLLSFLLTRGFRGPVAVVVSYRSDDLHRRHPLRATAGQWARVPGVHRVVLDPLPDIDVRALVEALLDGPGPGEDEVRAIVARAEGNAFFAEELVGASEGSADGRLPDDLADLLLLRLDRLGEPAREVVRAASCAGRRVTHELLACVVPLGGDDLDRALRDAVEQHVLTRVGDDSYAFRHALLAEAVHADLLPGERVRLHAAYTAALLSGDVDGTAAELARHALAAHQRATAVRASVDAGDEAMSVGGPDEAAGHYETALELLAQQAGQQDAQQDAQQAGQPDGDALGVDLVELTGRAADARVAAGDPERALALVGEQLDHLGAGARPEQRGLLLVARAQAALVLSDGDAPVASTSEALRLLPDEPGPVRSRLLAVHARALAAAHRDDEAARFALESLKLARRLDLTALAADASTTLAAIAQRAGDPDAAERAVAEVVERARRAGDAAGEIRARFLLGDVLHERGALADAQEQFHLAGAVAAAAGRPWSPYGLEARLMEGEVLHERGLWDDCVALTEVAVPPPGWGAAMLLALRARVLGDRGDPAAGPLLEQARPGWSADAWVAVGAAGVEIDWYGARGDLRAAWRSWEDATELIDPTGYYQARVRLTALLLGRLADAAPGLTATERAALVADVPRLLAGVESVMSRVARRGRPFGSEGRAWLARVHAEHLRLRWLADVQPPAEADLLEAWEQTVAAFDGRGHAHETARSQARLAAVLRAAGRPADAVPLVEAARETARRLGARPLLAELGRGPAPRALERGRNPALTPRETEILRLVSSGRSNGEIGRQLFISTKTVSVHVSNILGKLRAGGRTEAAAIARRDGLLED